MSRLNIVVFDIETAPGEVYAFDPRIRWAPSSQWKRVPFMLQWSAVYLNQKKIRYDSVTPEEVRQRDDSRVAASCGDTLRDADITVTHNGDMFDLPWLRDRLWLHGLEPLEPKVSIDTRKLAKRNFGLTHNSLEHLARLRLASEKTKTDLSWWTDIIETAEAGDDETCQKRLNRMLKYCQKDTRLLKELFETMVPYVDRLPRLADQTAGRGNVCPFCDSSHMHKRGKRRTPTYNYQRYQCQVCKRYSTSRWHDGSHTAGLKPG